MAVRFRREWICRPCSALTIICHREAAFGFVILSDFVSQFGAQRNPIIFRLTHQLLSRQQLQGGGPRAGQGLHPHAQQFVLLRTEPSVPNCPWRIICRANDVSALGIQGADRHRHRDVGKHRLVKLRPRHLLAGIAHFALLACRSAIFLVWSMSRSDGLPSSSKKTVLRSSSSQHSVADFSAPES
jgi:hypothetical protein